MKGLDWGQAAIGNATWSGTRLYDVLTSLGLKEDDPRAKHIQVGCVDSAHGSGYSIDSIILLYSVCKVSIHINA